MVLVSWKSLFAEGIHINFAWLTFIWDSKAADKAHVHCVIVGFNTGDNTGGTIYETDGGYYLFKRDEMEEFIKREPKSAKYFHPWYEADEFINNRPRYCLYLGECTPKELREMMECLKRVEAVRDYRLQSTSKHTIKLADTPTTFHVTNLPKENYIVVPKVSSKRREYISESQQVAFTWHG